MITDLSCPRSSSVNDGISPDLCSLRYASVDDTISIVRRLGSNTLLIKLDIKDAYRMVPVHPADYHLLGISWRDQVYIDRALPFGLRSAPKLFNAVADFVAWVLVKQGVNHLLHYLDDFLLLVPPHSNQGEVVLRCALQTLKALGIPVAVHKTQGPTPSLVFLGILIDTYTFELRLPSDKLTRLQTLLHTWVGRTSCTKHDLESLLGHLSHAATVIVQGRTFLRHLFPLLTVNRPKHLPIRLNNGAKADLLWWQTFLQEWNGRSFFPAISKAGEVISDASGTFGCGAFTVHHGYHGWFQLVWPPSWQATHITAKELVPIVIAAALWGPMWQQKCVRFRSDNMAVVQVLRSRTSKDSLIMHLLRCLAFYAAFFQFSIVTDHIPGVQNTAADAISRDNIPLFLSLFPQCPQCSIPKEITDLLVVEQPNWGSENWTKLFLNSLPKVSLLQQEQCTGQDGIATCSSAPILTDPVACP